MWPWEHAIVGYLVYSVIARALKTTPGPAETVGVVVGSQLPDIIDKPLFWNYNLVDTGYALGHSVFFAVPLVVGGWQATRRWGRDRLWYAFATGYLLHTPGDVIHGYALDGTVRLERLVWPFVSPAPAQPSPGVVQETVVRLGLYRDQLLAGDVSLYVLTQLALTLCCLALWLADGAPAVREPLAWLWDAR